MPRVIFSDGSKAWASNLNDLRERWQIRREEPVNYAVPTELFEKDIAKLSKDELRSMLGELLTLCTKAKKALHEAKANHYHKRHNALNYDEYNDIYNTVNSIGNHISLVNNRFSVLKDMYKIELSQTFMDVCRETLSREQWKEIMNETHERMK